MIAGRTTNDVEHFQDRNAAADQLGKGPRKTRHANLMNERTEDRQLEFPTVPQLFAAGRTQKRANAKDSASDTGHDDVPLSANKIADINTKLCGRGKFGSKIRENLAEDR